MSKKADTYTYLSGYVSINGSITIENLDLFNFNPQENGIDGGYRMSYNQSRNAAANLYMSQIAINAKKQALLMKIGK